MMPKFLILILVLLNVAAHESEPVRGRGAET